MTIKVVLINVNHILTIKVSKIIVLPAVIAITCVQFALPITNSKSSHIDRAQYMIV